MAMANLTESGQVERPLVNGSIEELAPNATILELDPEVVAVDSTLSALRDRDTERYKEHIIRLAASIKSEGQFEPAIVRESEDGFVLVAGECRRDAVKYLREQGGEQLLRVIVDDKRSAESSQRVTLAENIQRRNFTPTEFATRVIPHVRQIVRSSGAKTTKAVAAYLGVSPATVTEHEKLARAVGADPELAVKVDTAAWSPFAAFELAGNTVEGRQEEVSRRAEELAKEELTASGPETSQDESGGVDGQEETADAATGGESGKKAASGKSKGESKGRKGESKPKVEAKHVRKAQQELDAAKTVKAPRPPEIRELWEAWTGPAYPQVMAKFAGKYLDWMAGKVSEKQLAAYWDDIADEVGGTATPKIVKAVEAGNKAREKARKKAAAKKKAGQGGQEGRSKGHSKGRSKGETGRSTDRQIHK